MPPGHSSSGSRQTLEASLLEPGVLVVPDGLKTALAVIERVCYHDDSSIMDMILGLSSRPHVLEYILSTLNDQAHERLSKWSISRFPVTIIPNLMQAWGIKLVQLLSSSLVSVEGVSTTEHRNELRNFRRKVDLFLEVLSELGRFAASVTVSPVSRKRGSNTFKLLTTQPDPYPFDCMGIAVPATEGDVWSIFSDILTQLQSILGYYLLVLRRPRVSNVFKRQLEEAMSTESVIQPIKVALYFEDVAGFGKWRILLSTRAQKYLREVRRGNGTMFKIVVKKIKELSHGHFSYDNQKKLTGAKSTIPVYEAKMTGDTRLVYRIDCIPHGEGEIQAIRIFGIYTHTQMAHGHFWDTLSRQLQNRGPDYVARCTFRNKPLDNVVLPASFPQLPFQEVQEVEPLVKVCEEDMKNIHSMLVLEKFVILSQALLNSIIADKEVAHMFTVSAQEQEIIENPASCYVIGRSGTGKTTTVLFKMLGIERAWKQFPDMWEKPRQIFVTQSRVLATKVEEYFSKLMLSVETASHSPEELRKMDKPAEKEMELLDLDDIDEWRGDLPKRFSELTDDAFPLFITYEQLCLMLQNDISEENDNDGFIVPMSPVTPGPAGFPTSPQMPPRRNRHRGMSINIPASIITERGSDRLITYLHFLSHYWNHISTGGLDPALVFGEIVGVIKGSEKTIDTEQRCLSRDTYLASTRRGMSQSTKEAVYDLFTKYTRLKRQRQEYDSADRTHHILGEFRSVSWRKEQKGEKVDFLYIDEVQDNLLIDTLVLRTLCKNPNGLFWAGDTAQTISIGSSFKFSDLKGFQYRVEKELRHEAKPTNPKTYELVVNYRSHGGIVNCARSVVELITLYWPHSIDILQPERASVDGFRPIFFSSQGNCDFERSFFGDGQGDPVEFGADQCILVRDADARKQLKERLGERSIIMTLYESKGLEFNDVLLYNFFSDSTANVNQWRLVMMGISDGTCDISAPDFDETKHAMLGRMIKK